MPFGAYDKKIVFQCCTNKIDPLSGRGVNKNKITKIKSSDWYFMTTLKNGTSSLIIDEQGSTSPLCGKFRHGRYKAFRTQNYYYFKRLEKLIPG